MSIITYQIESGTAPFKVAIIPPVIPVEDITSIGIYETADIPDGIYSMKVTDHDNCFHQIDDIIIGNIVPPTTTSTTTTTTTTTTSSTTTSTTTYHEIINFTAQFHEYVCVKTESLS